jgi:hypothetical protein
MSMSLSASARLLMSSGKAGLRDGSTSAQRGPEPRAATRRRLFAPSMASMARTGPERPRSGAEGGVELGTTFPALDLKISRRAFSGEGLPPVRGRAVRRQAKRETLFSSEVAARGGPPSKLGLLAFEFWNSGHKRVSAR